MSHEKASRFWSNRRIWKIFHWFFASYSARAGMYHPSLRGCRQLNRALGYVVLPPTTHRVSQCSIERPPRAHRCCMTTGVWFQHMFRPRKQFQMHHTKGLALRTGIVSQTAMYWELTIASNFLPAAGVEARVLLCHVRKAHKSKTKWRDS